VNVPKSRVPINICTASADPHSGPRLAKAAAIPICAAVFVFSIAALFVSAPCHATTKIVAIQPTQMQARIAIQTDQPGNCTYRASRGTSFRTLIPDLRDNGNSDNRSGALVNGSSHVFVLGSRKGDDALASDASYWIGITCGTDQEISATFKTLPIPGGNLAPDLVPFNRQRFGNMDYPVIDWDHQEKSYVDPLEGVEFWRLTGPGLLAADTFTAEYRATASPPLELKHAQGWVTAANIITNGKSYATAKGDASDKLFIPLSPHIFYDAANGWLPRYNVDDLLANFYCGNAAGNGLITFSMQLSFDGGQTLVGKPVTTAPCPHTKPAKLGIYPTPTPQPLFRGWGISPPQHNLVVPPSGTVSVAHHDVTLSNPATANNYFVTDWKPGTPILIDNKFVTILSVESPTQLTINEDVGLLSNVPYAGANFGIVLHKNGSGTADVSVGLDIYASSVPDNGENGSSPMVNPVPVTVTKTADGKSRLPHPLKGYLAYLLDYERAGSIILWIPFDSDGSPRNEVRLLSADKKPSASPRMHSAGDKFQYDVSLAIHSSTVFDGIDGKSWYATDSGGLRFFRMTYDETLPGCAGFPAYNPYPRSGGYHLDAFAADDCFQWRNLTPAHAKPPMDLRSQMERAYQTGRNSSGDPVGIPHANFDLGWLGPPSSGLNSGGFFDATIDNGREHLAIFAAFDVKTGLLKLIRNTWGGDPAADSRWGGLHNARTGVASWRFAAMNPLDSDAKTAGQAVFDSAFDLPIVKVNRANSGAAPDWDTNTALSGKEAYTCPPTLPARYKSLAGTRNCIEVRVSTPPCSATPNNSYKFPDGKTEQQEFPCTTPGFGVADPHRSKLMDIQPGDWLRDRRAGSQSEQFVALAINYLGANDIDLWLLRWARHNDLLPLLHIGDDFQPSNDSHPRGWFLSMAPSFNLGPASMAIDLSAGAEAKWLADNPQRAACHGTFIPGATPPSYSYAEPCDQSSYRGNFNSSLPAMIFAPFAALPVAASYPQFAGTNSAVSAGAVQSYSNATWSAGSAKPPFLLDFRHLNPSFGAGPEVLDSFLGNSRALTRVSGTKNTYEIQDHLSAGPSDYKRVPLFGHAGHYLLQDVSAPSTGNTQDLPDYSVCRAFNPGECFARSEPGNIYVGVPRAYVDEHCRSDQFTLPDPCVFQLGPFTGQAVQFSIGQVGEPAARKLGYIHGLPGLQYQFSNCRSTPDANFAFCVADWLDGVRSEWVALRLSPFPGSDHVDRSKFVSVPVVFRKGTEAAYFRVRFGYAENGPSLLCCTPYQSECTSETSKSAPQDPYSFINEKVTRQSCAAGDSCTLSIPAISNRMLYYVVDRLDSRGAIINSDPMQVVAVP
jgi:hypothetical protein